MAGPAGDATGRRAPEAAHPGRRFCGVDGKEAAGLGNEAIFRDHRNGHQAGAEAARGDFLQLSISADFLLYLRHCSKGRVRKHGVCCNHVCDFGSAGQRFFWGWYSRHTGAGIEHSAALQGHADFIRANTGGIDGNGLDSVSSISTLYLLASHFNAST